MPWFAGGALRAGGDHPAAVLTAEQTLRFHGYAYTMVELWDRRADRMKTTLLAGTGFGPRRPPASIHSTCRRIRRSCRITH